ncbi:3-phosphoshikimate 1-carboxyvinyltransferase [uncultured Paraglaciecola sp.]|uniref:3-phosphoshikimate 1-carboxyvinyltransferase n=1 Tax=uncultured Paraglaciecola sp. TaxID=1765024 RepID=UPI0030DBCC98
MDEQKIRQEVAIRKLLDRMPQHVAQSFTEEQLLHLKVALGARKWGRHKVDVRGTLKVPFIPQQLYYVFLIGRNYRSLSRREKRISAFTVTLITSLWLCFCILFGLLVLYLVKSALGINLFEGFSLGIWGWFKELIK